MERRLELDGLRGVAILLVVFAHVTGGVWPSQRGLAPWLGSDGGVAGVQLFFVLSGYLITGVLLRRGGLVRFYRRRWRRLFPTLVVVTLVAVVWSGDAAGGLRALTYTENIPAVMRVTEEWGGQAQLRDVLGHTWSLAVEEQFYLAWPLLLLISGRHAAKLAAAGVVLTWTLQHSVGWSEHAVYVGLRWDAVLAGCLLALVPWRPSAGWFAAGGVVLWAYTLGLVDAGRSDYMVLSLASVAVVASAHCIRQLEAGWLVHVGRISYALYLWHVLVMRLDWTTLVTFPLSLLAAEATYLLVDRRAQLPDPEPVDRSRVGPVRLDVPAHTDVGRGHKG